MIGKTVLRKVVGSNPLAAIPRERLLEAAQRGMWAEPDAETLAQLQSIYLQIDGELEGRGG